MTFSGGMKRRLEIARGLLHHPKVLFLDEPTLGLDVQTRNAIWRHVRALRDEVGTTVFMTTHYMDEAENCDRIAIIDHGKIQAIDTPAALKRSHRRRQDHRRRAMRAGRRLEAKYGVDRADEPDGEFTSRWPPARSSCRGSSRTSAAASRPCRSSSRASKTCFSKLTGHAHPGRRGLGDGSHAAGHGVVAAGRDGEAGRSFGDMR